VVIRLLVDQAVFASGGKAMLLRWDAGLNGRRLSLTNAGPLFCNCAREAVASLNCLRFPHTSADTISLEGRGSG